MKLAYKTNDGQTFDTFAEAQAHEQTTIDNQLGALVDALFNKMHLSNRFTQKSETHAFLLTHKHELVEILTSALDNDAVTEESVHNDAYLTSIHS